MKRSNLLVVLAALGTTVFLLTGCYPGGGLTTDELDIVGTDYDPDFFASSTPRSLYFMPDSVGVLGSDNPDYALPREDQEFILNLVEQNLNSLGYSRTVEPIDAPPDVVILVSSITIEVTGSGGCIPWYPGWGWGGWWPGWGWGPGYCYPSYIYQYTTGTLAIDMLPQDQGDADVERVWHAGLNGLVRSSDAANRNAITRGIDQAFAQSPYLKVN